MTFTLETMGNATLLFSEDVYPILATDPWLIGTCYYGSWGLDRPLDERELQCVLNAKYIWISHGHPDHLHIESLALLRRNQKILIPDHYSSGIYDFLSAQGFSVQILKYRHWQQLTPNFRCLCLDNPNQDAILIVEAGDSLIVNKNDSPLCGESRFIRRLVRRHDQARTYLAALCSIDADMLNFIDAKGQRNIEAPELRKPGAIWEAARIASRLGFGNFICSSSQHVYVRFDSAWANAYRITISDMRAHWTRPNVRLIEPYVTIDLSKGSYASKSHKQRLLEAAPLTSGGDDWDEPLEETEWAEIQRFLSKFEILCPYVDFIDFSVAGRRRRFWLKPKGLRRPPNALRGAVFHVPRRSLMHAVRSGYFDDLLIGNFMRTELHNVRLYPRLTPIVAKLGGSARVYTRNELRAFNLRYFRRNPVTYVLWKSKLASDQIIDSLRSVADRTGLKQPARRLYRFLLGDPVL